MSTTTVAEIQAKLDLDDKKFTSGLNSAEGKVKGFAGKLGNGIKSAAKVAAVGLAAAGAAAVAFGVSSVKAYNQSTEAATKLSTNLLAVKGNTKANVTSLDKLAASLQSVGVIEDDVIKAGMSQLATFGLQGKTIETLTPKITDMVAQLKGHNATAEDMVGINNLMGKVMTGNIGALGRYGVTLSEKQKQQMKDANETERAALMVEVLSQNYGKVNEALANTPQGQITRLKNNFGDLQEVVGEFLMNGIGKLAAGFNDWIKQMGGIDGIMKSVQTGFSILTGKINMTDGALKRLGLDPSNPIIKFFIQLKKNLPIVTGMIAGPLVLAVYSLTAALLTNPAVWILASVVALGAAIGFLVQKMGGWGVAWEQIKASAMALWNFLKPVLIPAFNMVKDAILQIVGALTKFWNANKSWIIPTLKVIATIVGGIIVAAFLLMVGAIVAVIKITQFLINAFITAFNWIKGGILDLKNNFWVTIGKIIGFFLTLPIKLPAIMIGAIFKIIKYLRGVNWGAVWNTMVNAFFKGVTNMGNAIVGLWNKIKRINWGAVFTGIGKGIGNAVIGLIEGAIKGALSGIPGLGKAMSGFHIPRFANGVSNFKGGLAVVGEKGPELVNLPKGSDVYPNGTMPSNITNNIYGNIELGDKSAVDAFFAKLNRNGELARKGLATYGG